jgi:hypothetical protein
VPLHSIGMSQGPTCAGSTASISLIRSFACSQPPLLDRQFVKLTHPRIATVIPWNTHAALKGRVACVESKTYLRADFGPLLIRKLQFGCDSQAGVSVSVHWARAVGRETTAGSSQCTPPVRIKSKKSAGLSA